MPRQIKLTGDPKNASKLAPIAKRLLRKYEAKLERLNRPYIRKEFAAAFGYIKLLVTPRLSIAIVRGNPQGVTSTLFAVGGFNFEGIPMQAIAYNSSLSEWEGFAGRTDQDNLGTLTTITVSGTSETDSIIILGGATGAIFVQDESAPGPTNWVNRTLLVDGTNLSIFSVFTQINKVVEVGDYIGVFGRPNTSFISNDNMFLFIEKSVITASVQYHQVTVVDEDTDRLTIPNLPFVEGDIIQLTGTGSGSDSSVNTVNSIGLNESPSVGYRVINVIDDTFQVEINDVTGVFDISFIAGGQIGTLYAHKAMVHPANNRIFSVTGNNAPDDQGSNMEVFGDNVIFCLNAESSIVDADSNLAISTFASGTEGYPIYMNINTFSFDIINTPAGDDPTGQAYVGMLQDVYVYNDAAYLYGYSTINGDTNVAADSFPVVAWTGTGNPTLEFVHPVDSTSTPKAIGVTANGAFTSRNLTTVNYNTVATTGLPSIKFPVFYKDGVVLDSNIIDCIDVIGGPFEDPDEIMFGGNLTNVSSQGAGIYRYNGTDFTRFMPGLDGSGLIKQFYKPSFATTYTKTSP